MTGRGSYNEARQVNVIRKLVADNARLQERCDDLLAACEKLLEAIRTGDRNTLAQAVILTVNAVANAESAVEH